MRKRGKNEIGSGNLISKEDRKREKVCNRVRCISKKKQKYKTGNVMSKWGKGSPGALCEPDGSTE